MADLRAAIDEVVEPPAPLAALREELEGEDPLGQPIRDRIAKLLPRFIYFSEYNRMPGRVSIRRLQDSDPDDLDPGERTALALLRLAGVETEEFTESDYEARKASLEAAANALTDEVFEFWSQNEDLEVELDIDFQNETPKGQPAQPPVPYLEVRIRNRRHRVTLNFSERSAGFVWFFSFLAFFSEFQGQDRDLVLLLDEPGLNLHGAAQEDLLRFIDDRLAPHHQVIYTTHSPFMVQADHLQRVRLVEDVDKIGTVVREDALQTNEETQFPIHAAIGIKGTQTLFLGEHTIIVEGNSDLVYLRTMSAWLDDQGRDSLDDRWVLLPVGGLDKMPTFLALLSPQLHIAAVHDVPRSGNQKLEDLVELGIVEERQLIALTEITDSKRSRHRGPVRSRLLPGTFSTSPEWLTSRRAISLAGLDDSSNG